MGDNYYLPELETDKHVTKSVDAGQVNSDFTISTDDDPQTVLNDAAGKSVEFEPGETFRPEEPLNISSNTTVYVPAGVMIKPASDNSIQGEEGVLQAVGSDGSEVTGVEIIGRGTIDKANAADGAECIDFEFVDDLRVNGVRLDHTGSHTVGEGIDLDDCDNGVIRGTVATNQPGYGIHNSVNSTNILVQGNIVRNCGFEDNRGGIDAFTSTSDCVYVGNLCEGNYRNFDIRGTGHVAYGNQSIGTTSENDRYSGVQSGKSAIDDRSLTSVSSISETFDIQRSDGLAYKLAVTYEDDDSANNNPLKLTFSGTGDGDYDYTMVDEAGNFTTTSGANAVNLIEPTATNSADRHYAEFRISIYASHARIEPITHSPHRRGQGKYLWMFTPDGGGIFSSASLFTVEATAASGNNDLSANVALDLDVTNAATE